MPSIEWFIALGTVVAIDLVLSGDNAIVIGLAASGLPPHIRRKAIVYGVVAATVLRVVFALVTFELLKIIGLTLAGGLLLAWVCWKMWREIRARSAELKILGMAGAEDSGDEGADPANKKAANEKNFRQALVAIVVADVSMALDNILGVAGAARDHFEVLIFGLILSIALMAIAANYIARIIETHQWLAYIGLVIIAWVAGDMIFRGITEVAAAAATF